MMQPPETNKLHEFLLSGKHYKAAKKQIVQSSVDREAINVVISGFIKRYLISSDGSLGIQIVYGPGDVFSLTFAFKTLFQQDIYSGPEVFYYEAMCPAEISRVEGPDLIQIIKQDPSLYADLLQEAGRHLEACVQKIENMELRTSHKKLAHQIAYLGRRFGKPSGGGIRLSIPLTHQDLADMLSLTRETISNNMGDLRKLGLVKTGQHIFIADLQKLEKLAYE